MFGWGARTQIEKGMLCKKAFGIPKTDSPATEDSHAARFRLVSLNTRRINHAGMDQT